MKNFAITIIILSLFSCAKPLTNGNRVVTNVKGDYVKFDGLNRWYYINADHAIKAGDTLAMRIKK